MIIQLVFYHGKRKWRLRREFRSVFGVKEGLRKYLLNYEYILFDTNEWDMGDERNKVIRDNVFLMSALLLMKSAYDNDVESIERVFELWREMGIIGKEDIIYISFILLYIMQTKDIKYEEIPGLRKEIIQKLTKAKPMTLGHAARLEGITPAAITAIMIHLEKMKKTKK